MYFTFKTQNTVQSQWIKKYINFNKCLCNAHSVTILKCAAPLGITICLHLNFLFESRQNFNIEIRRLSRFFFEKNLLFQVLRSVRSVESFESLSHGLRLQIFTRRYFTYINDVELIYNLLYTRLYSLIFIHVAWMCLFYIETVYFLTM